MEVPIDTPKINQNSANKEKRKYITDIFEKRSKERMDIISKLSAVTSTSKEPEDSVDLFFKSLALTVKKLPSNFIAQAKLKCLTFVTELEQLYMETPVDTQKNKLLSTHSASLSTSYSNEPPHITLEPRFESNSFNSGLQHPLYIPSRIQQIHHEFPTNNSNNDYNQYCLKVPTPTFSQHEITKRHGDDIGDIKTFHNMT